MIKDKKKNIYFFFVFFGGGGGGGRGCLFFGWESKVANKDEDKNPAAASVGPIL